MTRIPDLAAMAADLTEAVTALRAGRPVHVCQCEHSDHWFDRSICPEPCGMMHDVCVDCCRVKDGCAAAEVAAKPTGFDLALAELLDAHARTANLLERDHAAGSLVSYDREMVRAADVARTYLEQRAG